MHFPNSHLMIGNRAVTIKAAAAQQARQLESEKVLAESQIMSFDKRLMSIEVHLLQQETNKHSGTRWRLAYKQKCL